MLALDREGKWLASQINNHSTLWVYTLRMAESLMEWSAGKTWYKTEGQGEPLVVIHGGPGYPHFYLEGLLALASSER